MKFFKDGQINFKKADKDSQNNLVYMQSEEISTNPFHISED